MTTARRSVPVFLVLILVVLAALPAAAGAATPDPQFQLGPLNPAFVEALHDPIVGLGLGRMPSPVEVHVNAQATMRAARADLPLPSAYDLIDLGRVTSPVKDQKQYETCWAFANTAALESAILSEQGPALDLSEDNLIRRSGYFSSKYDRYWSGGWDFMAIAYYTRWAGPVSGTDDPYDYKAQTGSVVKHVEGAAMIPGRSTDLGNDLIKQLVRDNGGLSVGMYMEDGYIDDATSSYFYPDTPDSENHGVVIVGWDDSYPVANFSSLDQEPAGPGAFLVRNSWGPGFGDNGYFWVSYYDRGFARDLGLGTYGGCTSYSAVADVTDYSRNYGYDKLGVTDTIGYRGRPTVWAANRFTAASVRPITAVGFYTLSSNTPYEVWAGPSLTTLTRQATGTSALPGYATVKLDTPLDVTKGSPFVVAIKLTSPDGSQPLAIERAAGSGGGVFAPASARPGESYVGASRGRMRDLTASIPRANVCLKAFAR